MKIFVDELPQTIGKSISEDDVSLTEVRMWFETHEEIEIIRLADYDKQLRKKVVQEIRRINYGTINI